MQGGERDLWISGVLLEHLASQTCQEPSDLLVMQSALESVNEQATAQIDEVSAELDALIRAPGRRDGQGSTNG